MPIEPGQQFNIISRGIKKHVPKLAEFLECDGIKKMGINKLVGGPVLTYYWDDNRRLQQVFALDVILGGGLTREYLERVLAIPFNELLKSALIDVYNSYIPKNFRRKVDIAIHDIVDKQFSWV